jgi:hypothetical protein
MTGVDAAAAVNYQKRFVLKCWEGDGDAQGSRGWRRSVKSRRKKKRTMPRDSSTWQCNSEKWAILYNSAAVNVMGNS